MYIQLFSFPGLDVLAGGFEEPDVGFVGRFGAWRTAGFTPLLPPIRDTSRRLDTVVGILLVPFPLSLVLDWLIVELAGRLVLLFTSAIESNRKESPIVWALKSLTSAFILVCTVLLSSVISRVSRKLTLL